ncbi:MAG: hypothetical protein WC058_08480 [Phycisphaeraceae bacterium]
MTSRNSHRTSHIEHRTFPLTLALGLAVIALCELGVFADFFFRGRIIVPRAPLPEPAGIVQEIARWIAVHLAAIVWCGYLLTAEGLLTQLAWKRHPTSGGGGCVRRRPWLFIVAYLTSVPVWCYWDFVNFYFMDAWRYFGMMRGATDRYVSYFFAFAAISPAMFLAAQLYQQWGLAKFNTNTGRRAGGVTLLACGFISTALTLTLMFVWRDQLSFGLSITNGAALLTLPGVLTFAITRRALPSSMVMGAGWVVFSILIRNPISNFTLWAAPLFLLDPINAWRGRPSILRDWMNGRWGRTISLMAGGLTCGLLWEFWNYFAVAKWIYVLPFLGPLEQVRWFEMPVIGLIGFLPFGPTCWVMMQSFPLLMPGVAEETAGEWDVM